MRINKYIASCGVCGRRAADKLIQDGKVTVNGKVMTDLSYIVDTEKDKVSADGKKLKLPNRSKYIMLHKPKGYVCTNKDEKGRKTVFDLLPPSERRLFSIGRLDYDTEGLLILTDDGDLAQRLTHPSSEIGKTYVVNIEGEIADDALARLRNGIELDDGYKTGKSIIRVLEKEDNTQRLEVTIYEGHNRQIKRMFEAEGAKVVFLKRTKIGDLRLGGLTRGTHRELKDIEINYLKNM